MLALLALLALPAAAQDCNGPALARSLTAASPVQAGPIFVELARCDAATARKVVAKELPRVLPGEDGDRAAVATIEIGATDVLLTWMKGMDPSGRSRTIAALGEVCDGNAAVRDFLMGTKERLGDEFWTDRWFRALSRCGGPEVGAIFAAELDKPIGPDRSRFLGLLEVYARSQGPAAIPKLKELAARTEDPETLSYIVQSFSDAARVGVAGGARPEDAAAASQAITELAPSLPLRVVDAARVAMQSLGDEAGADALAAARYRELAQADGSLLWGAVAVETAPCKKGKQTWRRVHLAEVKDPGRTWADQLSKRAQAAASGWELSLGKQCKAEASVEWRVPAEPFADEAALKAWHAAQLKEIDEQPVDRSTVVEQDTLQL